MRGMLYGVGVGPGDPELMTLKAVRVIRETDGYRTELVSGVPSFCAAAASLKIPLTEGKEMLHVIPASYKEEVDMKETGTYILMKTGRRLQSVKEQLHSSGFQNESVFLVENSRMTDEKIYRTMDEIPDKTGYFSTLITKKDKGRDR